MAIEINGNDNIVAGGDVIIRTTKETLSECNIPKEYREKYYKLLDYLVHENDTKDKKESKIFSFIELLIKSGAPIVTSEVTKYLLSLL